MASSPLPPARLAAGRRQGPCNRQVRRRARNGSLPRYDIIATSGPEHDRIYECVVRIDGGEVARGSGPSRRAAEAAAAEAALRILLSVIPAESGAVLSPGDNELALRFLAVEGPKADSVRDLTIPWGKGIAGFCMVEFVPLRDRSTHDALWRALSSGAIDCIGSDHVAHTRNRAVPEAEVVVERTRFLHVCLAPLGAMIETFTPPTAARTCVASGAPAGSATPPLPPA